MKTQTLLYLFLALPAIAISQATVVTDPGSYSYLAETATQAANTVQQAKKQIDILSEARDVLKKVNNTLRDLILLDDIINNEVYVVNYSAAVYRRMEQSGQFTPDELARILFSLTTIVTMTQNNIKIANAVSKDNLLTMNDAERMRTLQKISSDTRSSANDLLILEMRLNTLMQRKILQKAFGSSK